MVCAQAQLAALKELGVLEDITYLGCTSGGSWASSIFTYATEFTDEQLLDDIGDPTNFTLEQSQVPIPTGKIMGAARISLEDFLARAIRNGVPARRVWIEAVGEAYLQPFGLHQSTPSSFTFSDATKDDIVARNPSLASVKFCTLRDEQKIPYPIFATVLEGPYQLAPLSTTSPTDFEIAALGCGVSKRKTISYQPRSITHRDPVSLEVGGCLVEPFAVGSSDAFDESATQVCLTSSSIAHCHGRLSHHPRNISHCLMRLVLPAVLFPVS